jgi:membrane protein DedA with SNARE-associated domain
LDQLLQWVSAYGYFAIFGLLMAGIIGLPIPDETLLVFSGYLISRGSLNPVGALAAAFFGSACGITASYWIGHSLGMTVVHRYGKWFHITQRHIDKVHDWFRHLGHWSLMLGYFIPGVRHLTALVAGATELEYPQFALFAYAGALVWVTTFLSLGYFLGDRWQEMFERIHHHLTEAGLGILAVAVLFWLWRRRRGLGQ